ncbi:MAG TPA: site-specific integrase, partial [Anaerolineales bacterium]|nr:site-specific integrase [Anaerolineales bacterium]
MQDQVEQGLTFDNAQITVSKFLDEWLVSIEPSVRYTTVNQYRQIVQQHILPGLGNLKLVNLKPADIQSLYNGMIRDGSSRRMVQITHSVIHRALNHALKLGIVPRNAASATTPPRPRPTEMKFLDENEAQQFLLTVASLDDPFYPLYYLAIATGMRQGEMIALKWSDVDWSQKTMQVKRQLIKKKGGGFEFATPKTRAGTRTVDLGEGSIRVLQEHRRNQLEIASREPAWQENDMVFPSQVGTPIDRDNLRRYFKRSLKAAGLPPIRFHDLRHTAASLMLNNGIPVIVVSKRLGHSRPSMTLDVYGHLIPRQQQEAALLMDQLLTPISIEISR